jgi:hypothetical protein
MTSGPAVRLRQCLYSPIRRGVAGVSVSAATAFTGAAERRRNRSPTEQDATVHNIKCGKLSVRVLADGADPRVAEHRRHIPTVSPLADTRGFETRAARQEIETERPAGTRPAASAVEASRPAPKRLSTGCGGSAIRKRRTRRDRATPSPVGGAPRPCPPPRLLTAARHDAGAPIICVIAARIVWRASGSVIRRRDSSVR